MCSRFGLQDANKREKQRGWWRKGGGERKKEAELFPYSVLEFTGKREAFYQELENLHIRRGFTGGADGLCQSSKMGEGGKS
jgi:hypothetical protein